MEISDGGAVQGQKLKTRSRIFEKMSTKYNKDINVN